jgi:hypothetical protein
VVEEVYRGSFQNQAFPFPVHLGNNLLFFSVRVIMLLAKYIETVKDVLRTLEGPFSAQPLTGVVAHNPHTNRVLYYIVGQDKNGEDVLKKPAIV